VSPKSTSTGHKLRQPPPLPARPTVASWARNRFPKGESNASGGDGDRNGSGGGGGGGGVQMTYIIVSGGGGGGGFGCFLYFLSYLHVIYMRWREGHILYAEDRHVTV